MNIEPENQQNINLPPGTDDGGAAATGGTKAFFGDVTQRGKRVATLVKKGRNLANSAQLLKLAQRVDDLKPHTVADEKRRGAAVALARKFIEEERFSPKVETQLKREDATHVPHPEVVRIALTMDVDELDADLAEIVGPVQSVAVEIDAELLRLLAEIVEIIGRFGITKVGKVLIALQPPVVA